MSDFEKAEMEMVEIPVLVLARFQDDLIKFAERNWAPSHVEMLRSAIQCVSEGKEVYAPIEEEE